MTDTEPVQPDPEYIIAALLEENRAMSDNKLYLLAVMKQMQSEFKDARELWELERTSLKKSETD